ncbi:MAG: hypothetical protein FJW36_18610 [Acidobacteria bacterium]|nr:hypothetical protein [Acidobacteriota bacterium]
MQPRQTSVAALNDQVSLNHLVAAIPGVLFQILLRNRRTIEFTYLSPRASELFGYTSAAMMADHKIFPSNMARGDKERCYSQMWPSARTMSPCQLTFRFHVGDEIRWLTCQCIPELDAEGYIRWSGQFLDCTQQQQDQQQLERSRTLLQAAQTQSRLGI